MGAIRNRFGLIVYQRVMTEIRRFNFVRFRQMTVDLL